MAKPLLILDLDETLIHGSEVPLHREPDFVVKPFYIYKRPHLSEFLSSASEHYDLAAWSSAATDYVKAIAAELAKLGVEWQFVWSRNQCVLREHDDWSEIYFVKDLKKVKRLGYALEHILIVDDTPRKVSRNYGNAIYVKPFEGNDADTELSQLAIYIKSLAHESNFRTIEKRGWRDCSTLQK